MSLIDNNCLKYIIGLSRTACNCDYYAACGDFDTSLSELYLDELSPLNTELIRARADCEKGTLCNLMDVARSNAIKAFKADIYGLILRNFEVKRPRYYASMGKKDHSLLLDHSGYTYNVNRFLANDVVGGTLSFSKIYAGFDTTHNFNLLIYNNLGTLVQTVPISAIANTWESNTVTIDLPSHSNYIENLEYYFVYPVTAAKPFDNTIQYPCNCEHFDRCNCNMQTQTNKQTGWKKWVLYRGAVKNDLDFHEWAFGGTDYMNGLVFDVEFKCEVENVLCGDNLDFDSSPVALAIAKAIQLRGGIELIDLVLSSTELERKNLINTELMIQYRTFFSDEYKRLMYYDKTNLNSGSIELGLNVLESDCFGCKDNWGFKKIGILG